MVNSLYRFLTVLATCGIALLLGPSCGKEGATGTPISGVSRMSLGPHHACAVINDGTLKCWGTGLNSTIDDNDGSTYLGATTVTKAPAGTTDVGVVNSSTCVIANSAVQCWGANGAGELGMGSTSTSSAAAVSTLVLTSNVTSIHAGDYSFCAIQSGSLFCWGAGNWGQLGTGTTANRSTPVNPTGMTASITHASEGTLGCAVKSGAVQCHGETHFQSVGHGSISDFIATRSSTPSAVPLLTSGVTKVASHSLHHCAIKSGVAYCWGHNNYGELGDGTTTNAYPAPVPVSGLTDVTDITVGAAHTCAIAGNEVYCWGNNDLGQLGNGGYASSAVPVKIEGLNGATQIVATNYTTCAVIGDGVKCWGQNDEGCVGDGTLEKRNSPRSVILAGTFQASSSLPIFEIFSWIKSTKAWMTLYHFFESAIK